MSPKLRSVFDTAVETSNFRDLGQLVEHAAFEAPDATALELWRIANSSGVVGTRALAYFLVRELRGDAADGICLWLLENPPNDPPTIFSLLSRLTTAIAEDDLREFERRALPRFLLRCLDIASNNVYTSVTDVTAVYLDAFGRKHLSRAEASALANALEQKAPISLSDDTRQEIATVLDLLRSDSFAECPRVPTSDIEALVAKSGGWDHSDDLVSFVRVQRLLTDAARRASKERRSILTMRIQGSAPKAIQESVRDLVHFCQAAVNDLTSQTWIPAPAASTSEHARPGHEVSAAAFDRLCVAASVASQSVPASAFDELPGRQAAALASLILETNVRNAKVDFYLTRPGGFADAWCLIAPFSSGATAAMKAVELAREAGANRSEVYSEDIPQANTVTQVLQAVGALARRGTVTTKDIDDINSVRQVLYYLNGARVLGLIDKENELTPLGRRAASSDPEKAMRAAAKGFEQSVIGRAWSQWSNATSAWYVAPETALEFLSERAVGISGATIPRRASTLRSWLDELSGYA